MLRSLMFNAVKLLPESAIIQMEIKNGTLKNGKPYFPKTP